MMQTALALLVLAATTVQAQPTPSLVDDQVIPLWTGAAPGSLGSDDSDVPALTVYLPRTMAASTPAMIVCPGGSYTRLASNHEGRQVAVPAELHVFEKGPHGVGLANDNPALSPWSALLATWLRGRGVIK